MHCNFSSYKQQDFYSCPSAICSPIDIIWHYKLYMYKTAIRYSVLDLKTF